MTASISENAARKFTVPFNFNVQITLILILQITQFANFIFRSNLSAKKKIQHYLDFYVSHFIFKYIFRQSKWLCSKEYNAFHVSDEIGNPSYFVKKKKEKKKKKKNWNIKNEPF
ncbi:hypothetical protein PUN28_013669 [Cardiocondyla obscurior]|uniref:Uncharacterized protein n=1 Tax=Cardiocondyla obscurior TaxID=286306 RepID=A0AAW2F2E9_9HYME